MTEDEKHYVQECIENEDFDYAFKYYSDFNKIKDNEFHKLRIEYLEARKALTEYIGEE